jgi:GAF domain-containing protein
MFDMSVIRTESKEVFYEDLNSFVDGLLYEEHDAIANMSNLASLLYHMMVNVNWAGFYLFKENQLVLGPFNGKPACIRIHLGIGVCGRAAQDQETQLVRDVHAFEGHIACDGDTNSEIVIPMVKEGVLLGVLDIDSPLLNRFDERDQKALELVVEKLLSASHF